MRLAHERGNIAQTARNLGVSDTSILLFANGQNTPFSICETEKDIIERMMQA